MRLEKHDICVSYKTNTFQHYLAWRTGETYQGESQRWLTLATCTLNSKFVPKTTRRSLTPIHSQIDHQLSSCSELTLWMNSFLNPKTTPKNTRFWAPRSALSWVAASLSRCVPWLDRKCVWSAVILMPGQMRENAEKALRILDPGFTLGAVGCENLARSIRIYLHQEN